MGKSVSLKKKLMGNALIRFARSIRFNRQPRAAILLYHRVADFCSDPYQLNVSPLHFSQQMELLKQTCVPMHLLQFAQALRTRSYPDRSIVVTFDDGYVDNLNSALPVLECAGIPATIFITTGYIGSSKEFWWEKLARILLSTVFVSDHLQLVIREKLYDWPTATLPQRQIALRQLHKILRELPEFEREVILDDLAGREAQEGQGSSQPTFDRIMTQPELVKLVESNYVEVGAHSISHPFLSSLRVEEQHAEIVGSREVLKNMIGKPINSFSYPFGNYNDETLEIVRNAGFSAAVTTNYGRSQVGDDPFRLRRCTVNDWNIDQFKIKLESFFNDRDE